MAEPPGKLAACPGSGSVVPVSDSGVESTTECASATSVARPSFARDIQPSSTGRLRSPRWVGIRQATVSRSGVRPVDAIQASTVDFVRTVERCLRKQTVYMSGGCREQRGARLNPGGILSVDRSEMAACRVVAYSDADSTSVRPLVPQPEATRAHETTASPRPPCARRMEVESTLVASADQGLTLTRARSGGGRTHLDARAQRL